MKTKLAFSLAGILLSACSSSPPVDNSAAMSRVAAMGAQHTQKCESFGLKPGTEAYAACRLKLEEFAREDAARQVAYSQEQQRQENERRRQALLALGEALSAPTPLPRTTTSKAQCRTKRAYNGDLVTDCSGTTFGY
jgi:hypothetical protein